MTHDELMAACVQIICRHAGRAGLRVILFGSQVRGDAYPGSDIDLGILGPTPVPQPIMARIRAEIDALRTLRTVDVVDLAAVGAGLRTEALAHGRVVYDFATADVPLSFAATETETSQVIGSLSP